MNGILLEQNDNVITLLCDVVKDEKIIFKTKDGIMSSVVALQNTLAFHKIAIKKILKNEAVYKYGEIIGVATNDILVGEHVHVQNLISKERP